MKKYYSPLKKHYRIKRPRIIFRFLNFFLRIATGKCEVIWKTEEPKEPVVFIANHTRTYAPLAIQFNLKRDVRPWTIAHILTYRNGIRLFYKKIAYDFNPKWFRKIALVILMPLINLYFRSLLPIPVYHDLNIRTTFEKTNQTLMSGVDIIIYPEKNIESPFKYCNKLERGFSYLASHYYKKTNKKIKFYPVYVSKALKKILIGEPIEYNPAINMKEQRETIASYLENKINELGASLPEHKVYMNKVYPPEIDNFNF